MLAIGVFYPFSVHSFSVVSFSIGAFSPSRAVLIVLGGKTLGVAGVVLGLRGEGRADVGGHLHFLYLHFLYVSVFSLLMCLSSVLLFSRGFHARVTWTPFCFFMTSIGGTCVFGS